MKKLSKELNNHNHDLEKNGVEVVITNGLTFKHFAPLFDENNSLVSKAAIITDDDRELLNSDVSDAFKRIKGLENNNLKVFGATKTFEYEL